MIRVGTSWNMDRPMIFLRRRISIVVSQQGKNIKKAKVKDIDFTKMICYNQITDESQIIKKLRQEQ